MDAVERDFIDEWCERYAEISAGNRDRLALLKTLFEKVDRAGLRVLPLKGTDLLLRSYGGLGLRPMYDSDWWVHPQDVDAVGSLLRAEGFICSRPADTFWRMSFFDESMDYVSSGNQWVIDLQWTFWFLAEGASFWERARPCHTPIGRRLMLLPEDALFIQIAEVIGRRGWASTLFRQDLETLLRSDGHVIDWPRWTQTVKTLGLMPVIYCGLTRALAAGLENFPPSVLTALKPKSWADKSRGWLLDRLVARTAAPRIQYLLHWVAQPTGRARRTLLRRVLWPAKAWRERRLGRPLRWSEAPAFVFRPLRLLLRAIFFGTQELWKLFPFSS